MNIRKAIKEDIEAIREITLDSYSIYRKDSPLPWYNEDNIGSVNDYENRYFSKNSFINFIIEKNNQPAGFAICSKSIDDAFKLNNKHFSGKKILYIFDIGISRKYQNQGLGSYLFKHLEGFGKENNYDSIVLSTHANSIAHKWYKSMNFEEIASEVFLEKQL